MINSPCLCIYTRSSDQNYHEIHPFPLAVRILIILYSPVNINVVFWPNAKNINVARNLLSFKIQHQALDSAFVTIISNMDPHFVKIPCKIRDCRQDKISEISK